MKALTLTQPWASMVAVGEKRIETRSWETAYRGPLAIHAGKNLTPVGGVRGLREKCGEHPFRMLLARHGLDAETLPRGCVVATCRLATCFPTSETTADYGASLMAPWDIELGDYSHGRYGWVLADVEPLEEPIPVRGHQQLWNLDDALLPAS